MTDPKLTDGAFATWLFRLVRSEEWAELQRRYLQGVTVRTIESGFDEKQVAESARDYKGARAFMLWCDNEVSRKAGDIDGRATRYAKRAGNIAREVNGTGRSGARG